MTTVMKCSCRSRFQDERYGEGNRLHNVMLKDRKHLKTARCTVCEAVHGTRDGLMKLSMQE